MRFTWSARNQRQRRERHTHGVRMLLPGLGESHALFFFFPVYLGCTGSLLPRVDFSLWGTGSRPKAQQLQRTGAPLVAASLVAELGLWTVGSAAAVQTWLPCGKQDPPRPGIEPHVPALTGGSPTTGAPDKSLEASTGRTRSLGCCLDP